MEIPKLLSILSLTTVFLAGCNIKIESNAVDANNYLNLGKTPAKVYGKNNKGQFYNPFNFGHTDFGRLILFNIDNHQKIKTVELVVQHDKKGAFVIVYFHNGEAEIYVNSHLSIDTKYLKPNDDWKIVGEQDFESSFEDTKSGINFALDITINTGERIKIKLRENNADKKRFSFLAPIGADLSDVPRFPIVYLRDAGFVPIEGTKISFEIDGKNMKLTKIPIKMEGKKRYKIPYSFTPLPFFWNEEQDTFISAEKASTTKPYLKDNAVYSFKDNNGHKEVEKITYKSNGHSASYRFSPSFPDIASLKTGSEVKGKFCLGVDEVEGVVCGSYLVINRNDEISIDLQPKKCWQPMLGKDWVSKYRYHAKIKFADKNRFQLRSEWTVD